MPRHGRGWAIGNQADFQQKHTPLTISMLEPALLILLKEQPRHGYTLLTDLEKLGMGTIHPSVVYRTLREMERLTWVQSNWRTDQTQGPPRRTYSLTSEGEKALEVWQGELSKNHGLITQLLERVPPKERR